MGGPNRFSESENGFGSSPIGFRSQRTDLGVPDRFSESENGFRSSQSIFGVREPIWEFLIEFRSQRTDLGVPEPVLCQSVGIPPIGEWGGPHCLDRKTGELRWSRRRVELVVRVHSSVRVPSVG